MNKIFLDTNAYSALLRGSIEVKNALEQANQVFLSTICIGELLAGFRLGSKEKTNRQILQDFLDQPTVSVAPVTRESAEFFAENFAQLKNNGTPLPINDVWIASLTQEHGATLVTYDKHFKKMPGLRLWDELK
jgi:tRNA(fMet)-specific endonuclease VapC